MLRTRQIAYAAITAAIYAAAVLALAPISFGPIQLRAANALKALAICRPEFALGFAIGNFIANQASPFGPLDWAIMPLFDFAAAHLAWRLRTCPPLAIIAQSLTIAIGVATFPLGLGAHLPWPLSFASVALSSAAVITAGTIALVPPFRHLEAHR